MRGSFRGEGSEPNPCAAWASTVECSAWKKTKMNEGQYEQKNNNLAQLKIAIMF